MNPGLNIEGFQLGKPPDYKNDEIIKIYIIRQDEWGPPVAKDYRPPGNRWKNMEIVYNYKNAEYLVVVSMPVISIEAMFPPEKILYFIGEPTEFDFCKQFWKRVPPEAHAFPVEEYGYPTHWHLQLNYDELKAMEKFPLKSKDLSWVTTPFGDGYSEPPECQVLSGHKLRMDFLKVFMEKYPDKIDLFGRKMTRYLIPGNFEHFGGELWDKYDGVRDYRYSLAMENSMQKNYVSDKFADCVLCGTMPIYWGAPNVGELYPKNSYVWVDITKPDEASDKIIEIINSDFREQHLDEIQEAKQLVLDKYNFWEVIYRGVIKVHNNI